MDAEYYEEMALKADESGEEGLSEAYGLLCEEAVGNVEAWTEAGGFCEGERPGGVEGRDWRRVGKGYYF